MRPATPKLLVLACASLAATACSELVTRFTGAEPLTERVALSAQKEGAILEGWASATCVHETNASFAWLRCRTTGQGTPAFLRNAEPFAPLDLQGQSLHTQVRIDGASRLSGLELRVASHGFDPESGGGFAAWNVPVYGDRQFNMVQSGAWTPLSFSLGTARVEGKVDFHAIREVGLYVADDGKGPLDVSWTGLRTVGLHAQGYVSFTFDDGTKEHATVALPSMARHGFRGTAYVMPDEVGLPRFVDESQLAALHAAGWDVAAHHATPMTDLPGRKLEGTILGVQEYLQARGYGKGLGHLAYPLGRQDPKVVRPLVRKHFATARLAGAGPETIPPADPHLLRAVNVLDTTTPAELAAIAQRAKDHREWAILMFHVLTPGPPTLEIEYQQSTFDRAVEAIAATGVEVLPVSEVWERIQALPVARATDPAAPPGPAAQPGPAAAAASGR